MTNDQDSLCALIIETLKECDDETLSDILDSINDMKIDRKHKAFLEWQKGRVQRELAQ